MQQSHHSHIRRISPSRTMDELKLRIAELSEFEAERFLTAQGTDAVTRLLIVRTVKRSLLDLLNDYITEGRI